MSEKPYALSYFDHNRGVHGFMVVERFDTMHEATSRMMQLLQEDMRIKQISLKRGTRP